jgi:hypothetical protein
MLRAHFDIQRTSMLRRSDSAAVSRSIRHRFDVVQVGARHVGGRL